MKRSAVFASFITLLVAFSAQAVNYDLRLAFDTDRNAATGCTVTTPSGTFTGAEQVVNTRVDATGGTATTFGVTRQACIGGIMGSALPIDPGSWPAGLTSTGNLFIETHVTVAELGMSSIAPMRMAFFVTNGTLNDSVTATRSGNPLVWPHPGRHHAVAPTPAPPRTITLDGSDADWHGIPPVAGGGTGTADMRILNGYAFGTATDLFFAVRIQANHNAPTAADDAYSLDRPASAAAGEITAAAVGGTLNVLAPGVLANDTDPNSLPLSAILVTDVQHGTLALNANGSFTYVNDGSNAPVDTFEYKATNGTLDSNVSEVQIAIGSGGGPNPPPTPAFTSPDHATFNAGEFNTFAVTVTPLHPNVTITHTFGLPPGVSLVDNGNSTATLSGTPPNGSGGVYQFGIKAKNVVGETTQVFTLTVNETATSPVVTTNPNPQTVCNGATATFTAAATGLPSPSVQWQVSTNGGGTFTDIIGATNTTLSFIVNVGQNGNQYRAVFTNTAGTATTTAALLTVTTPSVVTTHPLSQTICAGASVSFTAAASGTPAPTVQWQVDSGSGFANIPGATSTTLTFVTAAADSGKQYRAVFTNACGSANTNAATLTVSNITVNPATLPNATQNVAYGPHTITATGGTAPYTFSTVPADLPPGVSLTGAGVLSGTPTTPGTYNFTITATDANGCTGNRAYTVLVCVTPSVSINASATTFCAGTNVIFTATPVNGGATPSYQWKINGGNVGTNSPTFATTALNNGDQVTVEMTSNAAPCASVNPVTSNTITVTVNANPATPVITPTPAQVCSGSTGNTATGPAGATTYAWSIVNGTITSATNTQNITYTAGASGTVDLTLVVTNASGCSATNTSNVTINPTPATPAINALPPQVCANSVGNTADGPAGMATYAWSITNGTITSATNIQTITYTAGASGTVDLTLVVGTGAGCSASNTVNITINANPTVPTITPNPAQVCALSTGNTADGPAGAATYAWSIVNGSITSATNIQTITYTAGATGTVDLTLVVTNAAGCSATNTVNVTINANPAVPTITPTPSQVCALSTGNTATGPAGATTYAWSIANGTITSATNIQAITYTAGATGTVDLTLAVTNASGCSTSNTVNVPINANPATPTITPTPAQVCALSTGNSAAGPAGATTYAWSIVNGSITSATNIQTITYTAGASGTVDLTLVVTNAAGCSATNTVNVTINANPAVPTITPNPAQVCALSAGNTADGPAGATTYAWSIVNGSITSATNIQTITYTAGATGTVDLTLVVTNAAGCSATNTVNVTINANPAVPTITPNPAQVCALSAGNTADGPAGATTYAWSIVNGSITSATNIQTITYTAGATGTVDLTLVVTNASGCSATNTVNVTINAAPATPTITPNPAQVCALSAGNTADGPAGATTYAWSIVNGSITSATNIQTITYTAGATGTVDLTLVVTNAAGCSATNTVNVTINANPAVPTITPNPAQVCALSAGNTADGPAGAATYAWSIVNGSITSATNTQSITYTAGASGTVDLTLVVTNAAGCSATNTVNVTINANPAVPTITPTPAQVCALSTGNSAAGPAGATTYAWSIVNGSITSATNIQTITYTAGATGTVDLTLVVTNAAGCSATNTVNVTINPSPSTPTITPTPAQVCANSTGNSADGPAGATTYAWSIVNGTITSATNIQTITYTAGASGTVDLTLVVTNAAGCPASNTVNVTINANPTATITPTPSAVCANSTGNSADGPAGATTYAWSIVNGSITSAANIRTITYTAGASGTVDLTLVVTNAAGCSDSNTVNVTINANPTTPTITPTPLQVCSNSTGNSAAGPAGATTYAWSIVNGSITSATNIQTITYTAGATGTVDLTLVVTNAAGCSASNTVNVTINANPSAPTITPTPLQVCANSTGNSADGPAGATTYAWSIVNGTITSAANIQTITYTAGATGTVDLTLVVTNASGCPASNTVNVTINANPSAPTITPTPSAVCANSTGNSADGPAGATTYAWSIVNGTITSATNIQTITYTAGASGTVDLTLVVTNAAGCSASNTVNVTINANPSAPAITPTPASLCPSSTGNSAAGPAGATTYAWSIVNGTITSATNIQTITYDAGVSGTVDLTLVVTNVAGCSASNTINVPISNTVPVVTTHPLTQSVQSGNPVTFTAAASGTPSPTVQWQVSVASGPFTDMGGETNTSLTFTTQLSQSGNQYRAVFTNTCGTATTNAATLTVTCPPVAVTRNPSGTFPAAIFNTAYTGESFIATGGAGPYTFAVTAGTFPPGLTLNTNGTITGTPTQTGTFAFTVTATDTPSNCTGSAGFTIAVNPVADAETYNTLVNNTQAAVLGTTTAPGTPFVTLTGFLIAGDLPAGGVTITTGTFATTQGGSITIAADGSFLYTPPVTASPIASDTYTYTISSDSGGTGTPTQATGLITFNLANRVWYVKNDNGVNGNGQSQSPFNTTAAFVNGARGGPDTPGDIIFVYFGSGTTANQNGGVALLANEQLLGQDVALVVNGHTLVAAVPGNKPLITNTAGNAVTLANGNIVQGLNLTGPTGSGISGTSIAGFTGNRLIIQGAGAGASGLILTSVTGAVTLTNTAISNSPFGLTINNGTATIGMDNTNSIGAGAGQRSVQIVNRPAAAGNITIGATITDNGTGATVTNNASGTIAFTGAQTMTTTGNTAFALATNTGATINFSGNLSINTTTGTGFSATTGGTLSISGTANVTTAAAVNGVIINGLTSTGITFNSVNTTGATTGVSLTSLGNGNVTINGGTIASGTTGLALNTLGTSVVTLSGVTFNNPADGITGTNFGTLSVGTTSVTASLHALVLNTGTVNGTFTSINCTPSGNNVPVTLNTVAGNFTVSGGAIGSGGGGSTPDTFVVVAGTATIVWNGTMNQAKAAALINVSGGNTGNITFGGAVTANTGTGLQFSNADGTYAFNSASNSLAGGDAGVDILLGSSGTFSFAAGMVITNPSGIAFNVNDSTPAGITYPGTITASNGRAVAVNRAAAGSCSTGTLLFSGNITSSGAAATGILVNNCNAGIITFSGTTKTFSTQANAAITLTNAAGVTINFNGGNLSVTTTTGAAFTATGGGTINVAGSVNTLTSGTGNALVATSVTLGMTLQSITATGGATGVVLTTTSGSLSVTGTSGGLATGTGGTISGSTLRAVHLVNSSGTVSFSSMSFSIAAAAQGAVLVDNNTSGTLINNYTGCTFIGASSVSQNKALLQFESGSSASLTGNVQNSYFNNSDVYALFASGVGSSPLNLTVNQSGFGTNVNTGAATNQPGTTLTSPNPIGLGVSIGSSAQVSFNITNNTFWGASTGANYAVVFSGGDTNAGSNLSGTFSGNEIGKVGTAGSGCSLACGGVGVLPGDNGTVNVTISNNEIRQVNRTAIDVFNSAGLAGNNTNVIAKITNNTLEDPDLSGSPSAALLRAIAHSLGNSAGSAMGGCLTISGNSITGAWPLPIRITTLNTTGTVTIPGLSPNTGATTAQVETYIEGLNGAANTTVSISGPINNTAGGAPCP